MSDDPTVTDPDKYKVIFENDRVRVLSAFERRLFHGERETDVQLPAGSAIWVTAQEHAGENIGDTDSHAIFVELKDPSG